MKTKIKIVVALFVAGVLCTTNWVKSQEIRFRLVVSPSVVDLINVPVHTTIRLPDDFTHIPVEEISVILQDQDKPGKDVPGQILMSNDKGGSRVQLWWILPKAEVGEESRWVATLSREKKESQGSFSWEDLPGEYLDLILNGRKVIRYMYTFDDSSPERLHETYKPFHHVFDLEGKNLLTKGPGGLYTHHRGIFIGWNKLEFRGERLDLWHMDGGVQKHRKFLHKTAGPILARSESLIHWTDKEGVSMIAEQREITVFQQPSPTVILLEFRTKLKAVNGDVFLNGDPEHGGFQFRTHNDISKGSERAQNRDLKDYEDIRARYLFHEEGTDPRKDRNLPWVAMCFGLNDRHYTVQHMNHPDNPKPTVYSAYRDYGRFGAFFKQRIKESETLALRYRIRVIEGKLPNREKMEAKYLSFSNPPKVQVLK